MRYSVIRYITTEIQNAQGPHVHDPRTGQILESDIMWYHNVMNLLRNWYFVQTAAVNPTAQSARFKTEVMGELIRFVAAHEVGHTLGLPHNMGSSAAYPVDSLRSPTFTSTHGTAPSIMDYARFNYIAQPEDGITDFYPGIGEYDDWSIIYGYRPILDANSAEAERPILNEWIKDRANDPAYRFSSGSSIDPSAQTEDLGDNSMKSSKLGLANLKRIVPNLMDWATEDGEDYQNLNELYNQVLGQYRRYIGHVTTNVGGVFQKWKTSDEEGVVFTPVSKARQKEAVNFFLTEVFSTPTWLIDKEILARIENNGMVERVWRLQAAALNRLFQADRLNRLIEGEALNGNNAYTIMNLFDDTRRGIFSELSAGAYPDAYRRNLQRAYIDKMEALLKLEDGKYDHTDIKAVARGTLKNLQKTVGSASKKFKSGMSKIYVDDLKARIDGILDNKK